MSTRRGEEAAWRVVQEGFDPAREHEMESIFTVGNGYLGVRGALDTPLPGSRADLYISGVYDRKQPGLPYSELEFMTVERGDYPYHELVSLPFPFAVRILVEDTPLDLLEGPWRELRRVLDLARGVLGLRYRFEDGRGRVTTVETLRCASLVNSHLCLQEIAITCENHCVPTVLDAAIDVAALDTNHPHLTALASPVEVPAGVELHCFRTEASDYRVAVASRLTRIGADGDGTRWESQVPVGGTLRFRRYVTVYTSRDGVDPAPAALAAVGALRWAQFGTLLAEHEAAWAGFWRCADVTVAGSPATEQALRFNAYHLRIATDTDPRTSVAARTLTGRAYEGHVFWDVEIFMLPFYLHTEPAIARSLLEYRHYTLPGAREHAAQLGYRGACYAWESTVTGHDVTPRQIVLKTTRRTIPIFTGTQQIHVSADVAHGVWRYWEATGDATFMRETGVEILAETARFWASRCEPGTRQYHIRRVVGPDEYHHDVDDNAYTNWMARLNLQRAAQAARWLEELAPERWDLLAERLGIEREEVEEWRRVGETLFVPQPDARGLIEQFAGFFDLEDRALAADERFKAPIDRLFEWDRTNAMQVIKQADVLMLFHLFPEAFTDDVVAANYRYYEPRTDHGSSLSPAIHAGVAARLGLGEDAERYWRQSLWLDLSNVMNNSALGVHAACMGATWQALVFGFLGLRFDGPVPRPQALRAGRWPHDWRAVALELAWRGQRIPVAVSRQESA